MTHAQMLRTEQGFGRARGRSPRRRLGRSVAAVASALVLTMGLLVIVGPGAARAATAIDAIDLGTLGGAQSFAFGISD
ncbi:MAG: hypothetical protein RLZZ623_1916, partial [Actinomycetota bacterium]